MRKRNRGQKRKQGERGGGRSGEGKRQSAREKNEYSKYSMEATGVSYLKNDTKKIKSFSFEYSTLQTICICILRQLDKACICTKYQLKKAGPVITINLVNITAIYGTFYLKL